MLNKLILGLTYLCTAIFLFACAGESLLTPVISPVKRQVGNKPVWMKASAAAKKRLGFIALAADPRIAYESGSKDLALQVQRYLDDKVAIIQQRQYAPFNKPVLVYVLNSEKSIRRYCIYFFARGCVVNQKLFITKRAKSTLPNLLQHELSHLHLEQKLGMYRFHSEIPAWFQEGLAVFVSDGAGAEKISFTDVIKGLRSDKSITPNSRRSFLFPKRAAQFGMKSTMFYAQCGVFVKYLYQKNHTSFRKLILSLSRGDRFAHTINAAYGKPLSTIWSEFKSEISENDDDSLRRYSLSHSIR